MELVESGNVLGDRKLGVDTVGNELNQQIECLERAEEFFEFDEVVLEIQ